jgi:hypothetical protein
MTLMDVIHDISLHSCVKTLKVMSQFPPKTYTNRGAVLRLIFGFMVVSNLHIRAVR